jgi:hypothetical protein
MKFLPLLCFFSCAQAPMLQSQAPSNVFVLGQPVVITGIGFQNQTVSYTLSNYHGERLRSGVAPNAVIRFNMLPVGYYTLTVSQGSLKATTPIAVVYPPRKGYHGSIATDVAAAWLVPPRRFSLIARLLHLAGFGYIRERLSWSEVEPKPGLFQWGKYDDCITIERSAGLTIDDVFHDCPIWVRRDRTRNRFPDDLRYAYRFAKALAQHFHDSVKAWEVWNEPDGNFSVDLADQYAAFLKACYLGFKAGDPHIKVAQASLAYASGSYAESLFANDTQDYFDLFNYHVYTDPMQYPLRAESHIALMRRKDGDRQPIWVTEAGISLQALNGELSPKEAEQQADFIPKSYAMSLASRTTKHFFFVFPHYLEAGSEFGVLTANYLPYPGYCALAAVTHFLGEARYLGCVSFPRQPDVVAQAFSNGLSGVLVMWREGQNRSFGLPRSLFNGAHFYNAVGTPLILSAPPISLTLGQSPLFVEVSLKALKGAIIGKQVSQVSSRPPYKDGNKIRKIVLRAIFPDNTIDRTNNTYDLPAGQKTPFSLQVYNFSEHPFHGDIDLHLPLPWKLSLQHKTVIVPPMGLTDIAGSVAVPSGVGPNPVLLSGFTIEEGTGREGSSISLSLAPLLSTLKPMEEKFLKLDDASRWSENTSLGGTTDIRPLSDEGIEFHFSFHGEGDRWAYPYVSFHPPVDFNHYDAIRFDYKLLSTDTTTVLRLMLGNPNGSLFLNPAGLEPTREWKTVIIPFRSFVWGDFSPPAPQNRLDLHHIERLLLGCNTQQNDVTLMVRHIALVRYADVP